MTTGQFEIFIIVLGSGLFSIARSVHRISVYFDNKLEKELDRELEKELKKLEEEFD